MSGMFFFETHCIVPSNILFMAIFSEVCENVVVPVVKSDNLINIAPYLTNSAII